MNIIKDIWRVAFSPLPLYSEYKNTPRFAPAALVTAFTCALSDVAAPLANLLANSGKIGSGFTLPTMLPALSASVVSVLISCLVFRLLAAIYKKPVTFRQIFSTWGLSFLPTILAIVLAEGSEAAFYLFIGNAWLGLLVCTLLVLVLAWKAIFFFMELNVVLGLKGSQIAAAVLMTAAAYILLIIMCFNMGLKVPVL